MIEKILISIIFLIIIYEIYLLNYNNSNEETYIDLKPTNNIKQSDLSRFDHQYNVIENTTFNSSNRILPPKDEVNEYQDYNKEYKDYNKEYKEYQDQDYNDEKIEYENEVNIPLNLFGNPTDYEKNNFIIWDYLDSKPWTKIIYNYNELLPFKFYYKVTIPSLNDYNDWKKILSNLEFSPRTGELIIPAEDEEMALSIANLINMNFKGDIKIEEILKRNLIEISINKTRKYEIVKNKLIDILSQKFINKIDEIEPEKPEFQKDLASSKDYEAYEGSEYSFF